MNEIIYKVIKNNYILRFTKEKKGLVLKISHKKVSENKYFSIVPPGNVYMYIKNKWELLDTATLKHERKAENYIEKSSYDLIRIIQLFPLKEILELSYDEIFFLQALAYDLFTGDRNWLPIGTEYEFVKDKLISKDNGYTYTYEMPSCLGISLDDFLNKENNYIKKEKKKTFLDKIPLKISPKNKKIIHKPDSPIKVPLTEYTPSNNKIFEPLPEIKEKDIMDISTEDIISEEIEKTITASETEESEEIFKTDDITLTEEMTTTETE